jgi:hypothetical protein
MKISINQIRKLSVFLLDISNGLYQIEDKILGLEDKVNILEQSDEEKGKKKNYK